MTDTMGYGSNDVGQMPQAAAPQAAELPGDDEFVFNFDEAIAPKGYDPIPDNVYNFVITDAPIERSEKGWTMINVNLQVEGGEYDGRLVFDRWVMPNRSLQQPDKYRESMGFLQQRLEAIYQHKIGGDQKLNPQDLLGRRCKARVRVVRDKMPDQFGPNGEQLFYDPKNVVRQYFPLDQGVQAQAVAPQAVAQPVGQPAQAAPAAAPQAAPQPAPQAAPAQAPAGDTPQPGAFRL